MYPACPGKTPSKCNEVDAEAWAKLVWSLVRRDDHVEVQEEQVDSSHDFHRQLHFDNQDAVDVSSDLPRHTGEAGEAHKAKPDGSSRPGKGPALCSTLP